MRIKREMNSETMPKFSRVRGLCARESRRVTLCDISASYFTPGQITLWLPDRIATTLDNSGIVWEKIKEEPADVLAIVI